MSAVQASIDNIEDVRKDLKHFATRFVMATESVSFLAIIPMIVLYASVNFNISPAQASVFFKCAAAAIAFGLVGTNVADRVIVLPITRYFRKLLRSEPVTEEEYARAQRRFFSLPYIHSLNSACQWLVGLLVCAVPFTLFGNLTTIQTINIFSVVAIIPPFGAMLFFLLTEIFMQKLLNKGIFSRLVLSDFNLNMSLMRRILLAILLVLIIPVVAINGYYMVLLEIAGVVASISFLKLGFILLFGIILAVSVVIALWRSITVKVRLISGFLERIGSGDLAAEKSVFAVVDELTNINQTGYVMKKNITAMMSDINTISAQLDSSSNDTSRITMSFSEVTQNQAATVEEVTATIEEISAGMDRIATGAQEQVGSLKSLMGRMGELSGIMGELSESIGSATTLASGITAEARQGEESLRQMNESMLTISSGSQQMTNIVSIIQDISDKINLLSLNASIEAARAGEAGRGFAVVADEISKLADNTATSVKEIDGLIKTTDGEIRKGLSGVTDVVDRIGRIGTGIGSMNGMVEKIAGIMQKQVDTNAMVDQEANRVMSKSREIEGATMEQKSAINEVVHSVTRINELTQTISAGSEEITTNTDENAKIAKMLKGKVEQFKIA
ncbi:MAG: hypothetical protein JXA20_08350 [Spirochaetes bacterium]|nr:hypothetical protein [Spirochaetota bacterium]